METEAKKSQKEIYTDRQAEADKTTEKLFALNKDKVDLIKHQMEELHKLDVMATSFCELTNEDGKAVIVQFSNPCLFAKYNNKKELTKKSKIRLYRYMAGLCSGVIGNLMSITGVSYDKIYQCIHHHSQLYYDYVYGDEYEEVKKLNKRK